MKKFLSALVFFLLSLSAFPFTFSIAPVGGIRSGQIDEYVFLNECAYDDDKLSELNWNFSSEYYAGGRIGAKWSHVFLDGEFSFGIPMKVGGMGDSDWLNADVKNAGDYQYKTNWSHHDNYLEGDFSFSVKCGFEVNVFENRYFKLCWRRFIGFEYDKIKFRGENGYAWYGNSSGGYRLPFSDEDRTEYTFDGKVISYERRTFLSWLGVEGKIEFSKAIAFSAGFQLSPFVYAESIDTHWSKKTMYGDKTPGFFSAFRWHVSQSIFLGGRSYLNLSARWLYVGVLRGDSYSKSVSGSYYTKDESCDGGAGEFFFDISLGYEIRIGG